MHHRNRVFVSSVGGNWGPTYVCLDCNVRLMIWEREDPQDNVASVSESPTSLEDQPDINVQDMACQVLDYRALDPSELIQSKTIKLEGELAEYPILLLVDSGDSHSFIARELVSSLNLEVTLTKAFSVGLGNESTCSTQGVCKELRVKLGRYTIVTDAYILNLGGVDIVLGVEWLKKFGRTTMDWQKKTVSFEDNGQLTMLNGHHFKDIHRSLVQYCNAFYHWEITL